MKLYHLYYPTDVRKSLPDYFCIDAFVIAPNQDVARDMVARFTHNNEWLVENTTGIQKIDSSSRTILVAKYKGLL